jgi:hypothetical protein
MTEGGYITLSRKFFRGWAWTLTPAQIKVFLYLLYRARWKPGKAKWWDGHETIEVDRGEAVISTTKVAAACKVSRKVVRRTIEILVETGTARANTRANRYTVITWLNYDLYQNPNTRGGQQEETTRANRGPTEGQPRATEENQGNQGNQEKERERARGDRDRDFHPPQMMGEQVEIAKRLMGEDRKAGKKLKDFRHYTHEAAKQMGMIKQ